MKTVVFGVDLDMMMTGNATMNRVNVMTRAVKMYWLSWNSVESSLARQDWYADSKAISKFMAIRIARYTSCPSHVHVPYVSDARSNLSSNRIFLSYFGGLRTVMSDNVIMFTIWRGKKQFARSIVRVKGVNRRNGRRIYRGIKKH